MDLELTAMRKENVLRTFRLGTGREDWGIMSTEHYLRVVSAPPSLSQHNKPPTIIASSYTPVVIIILLCTSIPYSHDV